jgi:hypothetical protein
MICRNCGEAIFGGKGDYFHQKSGNPTHCNPSTIGQPDTTAQFTAYPQLSADIIAQQGVSEKEFEQYREKLVKRYET